MLGSFILAMGPDGRIHGKLLAVRDPSETLLGLKFSVDVLHMLQQLSITNALIPYCNHVEQVHSLLLEMTEEVAKSAVEFKDKASIRAEKTSKRAVAGKKKWKAAGDLVSALLKGDAES